MTSEVATDRQRMNDEKGALLFRLEEELKEAKSKTGMGFEVKVKWLPGEVKLRNGQQLEEEVVEDTIFIYTEDPDRAVELLYHGFGEWLLNLHSRPYRQMINKFIELLEERHYEQKEKIADAFAKLLQD